MGPTLMHVFRRDYDIVDIPPTLDRFSPLRGECTDINAHPHINNPQDLDVDATCFMMLTRDIPSMFSIMAQAAYMVIKVRDSPEFADWVHVISDPVVIRIYVEST